MSFRRKVTTTRSGVPSLDPRPDAVDLPPVLADALAADPDAAQAWALLTPGKQRTLVYPVTRAKRPETQQRRTDALLAQLREDIAGH